MPTIQEDLRTTVAEISTYEPTEISHDICLVDGLGFDSLMLMDLFSSLAKKYPEVRSMNPFQILSNGDIQYGVLEQRLLSVVPGVGMPQKPSRTEIDKMQNIVEFCDRLTNGGRLPFFAAHQGVAKDIVTYSGKEYINFTSYNYLGTNGHPRITEAVTRAVAEYGTSVSASRIIGGEIDLHGQLESRIADFLGVEDSIVQIGGHSTNVNIIGNLFTEEDILLHDALAHNSIVQGALMSNAKRKPFKHNDMENLERELKRVRSKFRHVLIVAEGVYSMDGDLCPLPELVELREKYDAFLMIDEAHSIGTVGDCGRGVTSHFQIDPNRVDILMGTLSKAFNSCGGYIAGNRRFVEYLKYNLPGFVFSVGMTPANTAAALESLKLCEENPQWIPELHHISECCREGMRNIGVDTGLSRNTSIIPLITGDSAEAVRLSLRLFDYGISVAPIMYPAVNEHEARLRFFLSRLHTKEQLSQTFAALKEIMGQ